MIAGSRLTISAIDSADELSELSSLTNWLYVSGIDGKVVIPLISQHSDSEPIDSYNAIVREMQLINGWGSLDFAR